MRIALIGSNGLLASSIGLYCNSQQFNLVVLGLDEPRAHKYDRFIKVNFLNQELDVKELLNCDIIINAIGAGIQSNLNESSDDIYYLNTFFPIKVFKALDKANYKGVFITFGSYFEFGSENSNRTFSEEDIILSSNEVPNDYCISKRLLTRFISSIHPAFTYWHFILPTIYGETEAPHRLIPYVVRSIKDQTDVKLTSGEQIRQYLYINEIPEIIHSANNKKLESGVYNIAGSEVYMIKDLVKLIFGHFKRPIDEAIFGTTQKNDVSMKNLQLDGKKLKQGINYSAKVKVVDVLQKYWDYVS